MIFVISSKTLYIILICVIALLIVGVVITLLVLSGNNKNKCNQRLDHLLKQINLDSINAIERGLGRLKGFAAKNDDYVEIYKNMANGFKHLKDVEREDLIAREKALKTKVSSSNKIKKNIISQIKTLENAVKQYVKSVEILKKDLDSYFVENDELRNKTTILQKQVQQINDDLEKYAPSLCICINELKSYIMNFSMHFDLLEKNINSARHKEANRNIEDLQNEIMNVYGHIETIAQYCKMVDEIFPQHLDDLLEKNNELEQKGYIVSHARVKEFIENTNKVLEDCKIQFKNLRFGDFDDISLEIQSKLSEVHAHLDQEVMAKDELDNKYNQVSQIINQAESDFIKTKRHFSIMLEYYQISEEIKQKFDAFQKNATLLSDLKREYEGYLFVNAKNPASFMLEKVCKMEEIGNYVIADIAYFTDFFNDIKNYVDDTFSQINDLLIQLTHTIGTLRYYKCKQLLEKYTIKANECFSQLKMMKEVLLEKPIDVDYLKQNYSDLSAATISLNCDIEDELNTYQMVEKCILFTNPLRYQFASVENEMVEIERLFKDGHYKDVQAKIIVIMNTYHPGAYERFKV